MSNIRLSKKLSFILRHQAEEMGLNIGPDGYIAVRELMRTKNFRGTSLVDIVNVVQQCPKQRFQLKEGPDGAIYIRATQGHTIKAVEDEALLQVLDINNVNQYCIHGTYQRNVDSIRSSGLNRMSRNHIHLSERAPASGEVISGMRLSCDTIVTVDGHKAMAAGLKFFRSSNGVILCPGLGESGAIPPQYISDISSRYQHDPTSFAAITTSRPPPHSSNITAAPAPAATAIASGGDNPPSEEQVAATSSGSANRSVTFCSVAAEGQLPDYFCVLDFEATCVDGAIISPQEIIELPAVMVEAHSMRVIPDEENGVFHSYVRPLHRPQLSAFCTDLTGIQQSTVDNAPEFKHVFKEFLSFLQSWGIDIYHQDHYCGEPGIGGRSKTVVIVTHGDWDLKTMLPAQCALSKVNIPPVLRTWGNIKEMYRTLPTKPRFHSRGLGMASMLSTLEMELVGRHHSGIDDTRNIARILVELARRGAKVGATRIPSRETRVPRRERGNDRCAGNNKQKSRKGRVL